MSPNSRDETLFPTLSSGDIACVARYGQEIALQPGEPLFAEGDPEEEFYVVLDGALKVTKSAAGEAVTLRIHHAGEFTGALSVLTGGQSIATGHAQEPTRVLRVGRDAFRRLLTECPAIATTILFAMAERRPEADASTRQREKLAALGKMSAGLAHELNNPAAAGRRAAEQLRESFASLPALAIELGALCLDREARDWLTAFGRDLAARPAPALDALARSDREDEIGDWLEGRDVANGWDLAATLADEGVEVADLEAAAGHVPPPALGPVLTWLTATLNMGGLLDEVENSTARIADLVRAIKAYSYMDQAPQQDIDLHDGLDNTLTILNHKLKHGVTVVRDYDRTLPRVPAFGSELNQVWTNLIDNAVDAMDGHGTLRLRTAREGEMALVEIADDGPGIPPDLQARIFEPFFTTKEVGKGTGLGLDTSYKIVVGRHKGELCVDSQPGDTRFQVRLPLTKPPAVAEKT